MNDNEYARWIIKDIWQKVRPVVIMYAAVLTVYWAMI